MVFLQEWPRPLGAMLCALFSSALEVVAGQYSVTTAVVGSGGATPLQGTCGTSVPGGIVANVTWTKTGSPYCVQGDLGVHRLTIEPGVHIVVDGPYEILVLSTITAVGTEEEPVVLDAADPMVPWKGLRFEDAPCGSILRYCEISNSGDSGLELLNSSPSIENCTFLDNTHADGDGGAISASLVSGDLVLTGCLIDNNRASGRGGGVSAVLAAGTLYMRGCSVVNNVANYAVVPASSGGGGILVEGDCELIDTWVMDNRCHGFRPTSSPSLGLARGGGLLVEGGNAILRRCIVTGNRAESICTWPSACSPSRALGGGVHMSAGDAIVENCIIGCNTLLATPNPPEGGGLYVVNGQVSAVNCTIARNSHEGIAVPTGSADLRNCILFDDGTGPEIVGAVKCSYSNVGGGLYPGIGNISQNPIFPGIATCGASSFGSGDLVVLPGSPCIDAGDPDASYEDRCGLGGARNDMGAHGGRLGCPIACLATATVYNPGSGNPDVYTVSGSGGGLPVMGGSITLTVDCSTTGNTLGVIFGFTKGLDLQLAGGRLLVDVTCPSGELLGLGALPSPAVYTFSIPNNSALCWFPLYTQGLCFGGGMPYALTNAWVFAIGEL